MSTGRYSWEPAVLEALASGRPSVAAKIDTAEQAIMARLRGQHPPDACETSALMYALDALNALRALIDLNPETDAGD